MAALPPSPCREEAAGATWRLAQSALHPLQRASLSQQAREHRTESWMEECGNAPCKNKSCTIHCCTEQALCTLWDSLCSGKCVRIIH